MGPKEAYELKKEEKRREREQAAQKARSNQGAGGAKRRLLYVAVALAVVLALGYWLFTFVRDVTPDGEDYSRAFPILEASHIPEGSPLPEYNSNPPSSGPHYPQTARSGFRTGPIPDQNVIHNLEHGDIWIAFHPRIGDEAADTLKQFAAAKVIITPREANDTDIALVAWGRLDAFNLEEGAVPEDRIREFITRYVNRGPERVHGASGGI